jgi:flagellar protein FlbD
MIVLHRLGHANTPLYLNRDMVVTVEANPDTHITLTTGDRILVSETPRQVVEKVRNARIDVLAEAMRRSNGVGGSLADRPAQRASAATLTAVPSDGTANA